MRTISVKEILDVTKGKLVSGNLDREVNSFSLDSRTIKKGDVFFAIPGTRFDGHKFLNEAVRKGALGIIIKEGYALPENLSPFVIRVKNTIEALGHVAQFYRSLFHGPVISVTGTVGKTGTKEVISSVLEQKFRVHKTQGTLNNHIGVPITLMGLNHKHDVAVIELGMNRLGEIRSLADIAQPDVGIITNIGPAHLEYLGTIENIIRAKSELLDILDKNKLVILNKDDKYFTELRKNVRSRLITVGRTSFSDFQAMNIVMDKNARVRLKIAAKPFSELLEMELPMVGMHGIYHALFAAAVGYGLGLKANEIIKGLTEISLPGMRMEIMEIAGIKVINDCYNANPVSMASALDTVAKMDGSGRKIFVCGDMLELGKDSVMFHEELGAHARESGINRLVSVGKFSKYISKKAIESGMNSEDVRDCKNNIEAVEVLAHWLEPGDVVLVKGSRANRMEEIIKGIEECYNVLEQLIV